MGVGGGVGGEGGEGGGVAQLHGLDVVIQALWGEKETKRKGKGKKKDMKKT